MIRVAWISLVCFALASCAACDSSFSPSGWGVSARRTVSAELDLSPGDTLDVQTDFGHVAAVADAPEGASFEAVISASGGNQEEAESAVANHRIESIKDGGTMRLRLVMSEADGEGRSTTGIGGATAAFRIRTPPGVSVRLVSSSGAVKAEGAFAGVDARSGFGDVSVKGARGPVRAHTSSGSVTVEDTVGGDVDAESSFGRVGVSGGAGKARAESSSGAVSVTDWTGAVEAKSRFGAVTVDGVLDRASAETNSGAVFLRAREGSRPESPWLAKSSFGSVTLEAPASFSCDVSAETHFGKVRIAPAFGGSEGNRDAARWTGKLGSGGQPVTLTTSSGSVTVKPLDG